MPTITGQVQSYNTTGHPRDLMDIITMISPADTPFYTAIGNGKKATQTTHEWTTDALLDPADNAQVEGADVTTFEGTNVAELNNKTQILRKSINVSGTAQAVDQVGVTNQYNYQMANRMKEIKKDAERALISNKIDTAGNATTARTMRGLPAWIKTNVDLGATGAVATAGAPAVAGTLRALTKTMIAGIMQKTYTAGGDPTILMSAPAVRAKVTSVLKTLNIQDEDPAGKRVTDTVRVYESDFGELLVQSNRVQAIVPYSQSCLFILDKEYWKKSFMRNFSESKLAVTGDSMKGMIIGELTLESKAEQSSGMIADINPAL